MSLPKTLEAPQLKESVVKAVGLFDSNPSKAIKVLFGKSPKVRSITSFLHMTPGIDKDVLIAYLLHHPDVIYEYMKWFESAVFDLRPDLGLRLLISQAPLPVDHFEPLIEAFAIHFFKFNHQYKPSRLQETFKAMLDYDSDPSWSEEKFIAQSHLPSTTPSTRLNAIYNDLQSSALFLDEEDQPCHRLELKGMPLKYFTDIPTTCVIKVPVPDPSLKLVLCAQDIVVRPSNIVLDAPQVSFELLPKKVGKKKIFFVLYGLKASSYIPEVPRMVEVEEEIYQHQLVLKSNAVKQKMIIGLPSLTEKDNWESQLKSK